MDVWDELVDELDRYRTSVSNVRHYVTIYEGECSVLISKIAATPSFGDAQEYFDALHDIQRKLSILKYKFDFPLGDKLQGFIYHMERDDIYSRRYWYDKFEEGLEWPEG